MNEHKYHKYKTKYLLLKDNLQKGGDHKTGLKNPSKACAPIVLSQLLVEIPNIENYIKPEYPLYRDFLIRLRDTEEPVIEQNACDRAMRQNRLYR